MRAALHASMVGTKKEPENFDIDPSVLVPWPEDTPEIYREANFRRVVTTMAKQAGPPVELLDVDCDEPPCIAALHVGPGKDDCMNLARMLAWKDAYPGNLSIGDWIHTCEDGSQVKLCIMGKEWEDWSDKTKVQISERRDVRVGKLFDELACKSWHP